MSVKKKSITITDIHLFNADHHRVLLHLIFCVQVNTSSTIPITLDAGLQKDDIKYIAA